MPIPIILPKFGFTLESSTIVQWLKDEGEAVRNGDPICEVTTDKVNMEIEAPEAGTIYGLRYRAGDEVKVTEVICYLARVGEAIPERPAAEPVVVSAASLASAASNGDPSPQATDAAPITPLAKRIAVVENLDLAEVSGSGPHGRIMRRDVDSALSQRTGGQAMVDEPSRKVRATPAARHLAGQYGIELARVIGSGPRGRVQAADVQLAVQTVVHVQTAAQAAVPKTARGGPALGGPVPQPTPAPAAQIPAPTGRPDADAPQIVKLAGMRRTIATRLQKSHQDAPHIFVEMQVEMTAINALRHTLKARHDKLSVTAILVRACAAMLMKHRLVNSTFQGEEIAMWPHANIGVAVALDDGLVVPVIHRAEALSLSATQTTLDTLTHRARTNSLHISDMVDGTFTISNLGMYGVDRFTAIINPPQVAILAVGRIIKQFVPDDNDHPVLRSTMNLVLSADHRVIDGANAAQFLADLKLILEAPALMLW